LIFVNKQENDPVDGWSPYNRSLGVDFSFSPTETFNLQGFYARTFDSELDDADDARYLSMSYSGTMTSLRLKILDVEDQFEPAVGFVNRRSGLDGFRQYDVSTRLRPRPKPGNSLNVRYFSIGPQFQMVTDRDNNVKYWKAEFSAWTQFNTGDWWRMEVEHTHDVVDEDFEPSRRRDDLVIPLGTYDFTTFTIGPSPSRSRKFRPRVFLEGGTFYTGRRYGIGAEATYRPTGRFSRGRMPRSPLRWRVTKGPWYDNNLAVLEVLPDGLRMRWWCGEVVDGDVRRPRLKLVADVGGIG
jgi:hypothetical protein